MRPTAVSGAELGDRTKIVFGQTRRASCASRRTVAQPELVTGQRRRTDVRPASVAGWRLAAVHLPRRPRPMAGTRPRSSVQSLKSWGRETLVLRGGSDARYLPTGHLVYALEGGTIRGRRSMLTGWRCKGEPCPWSRASCERGGAAPAATANYGVSEHGTLVYVTGQGAQSRPRSLVWVDRQGRRSR